MVGALGLEVVAAAMGVAAVSVAAAASTALFLALVEQVLIPALERRRPDAVVETDNLSAHKAAPVRAAFDRAGIAHRHLPGIMEQTHLPAPAA